MILKIIQGDLLKSVLDERPLVIAHVVNDVGKWGKGFTAPLTRKFPFAETTYRRWAQRGLALGKTLVVPVARRIFVAHMCAQSGVFSKSNPAPFNLDALNLALGPVAEFSNATGCPIWMPKVGTGLGRGNWNEIVRAIKSELAGLNLVVFEFSGKE
jgi:O-acetyl-ADP-ribose deacetylase (regulator of RNase III)